MFLALNLESLLLERDREEYAALKALNVGNAFTFAQKYEAIWTIRHFPDGGEVVRVETGVNAARAVRRSPSLELPLAWRYACSRPGQGRQTLALKPSEVTPLRTQRLAAAIIEVIVNGYGHTRKS
ncbi:hypothetical protein BDZ89DRAFT_1148320 [Hymenopellis radicata]|nr:hypothetical protein BDZ89DRAFT_1148320 [Hymenopellis radicata]